MKTLFWTRLDELLETSEIVIDRPKGTPHPRFPDFIFPLDYGYLKGTTAMDGGGIDVWIGSTPQRQLTAIACTVDILKKDTEIKLIVGCTDEEIAAIENSDNNEYMSGIIIRREDA